MSGMIEWALARNRLVIAVLALVLLAGWMAWRDIPKESEPDVRIPIIYVSMRHDGISPEDAERLLVRPMELELRRIEGVKEMRASAYEGGAFVLLEFEAGFNADRAVADVRERVDRAKPNLPTETDEPTVHEINLSLFPVLAVTLAGEVPERTLLRLARDLRDRIEQIPAVLEARIVGTREELVEIVIDPMRAQSYGLSADAIIRRVASGNQVIAAGSLDTGRGRFSVQVPGLLASVNDILTLPVIAEGDRVVRVGDIAEVRRAFRDRQATARVNGRPAVVLEVSKRTGENIIDTIAQVRAVVDAARANWSDAVVVGFSQDRSEAIRTMLADLENNLLLAAILVLVIVLASLGWRTTTLVAVAVPGSFLAGILMLAGMGLTINIVVLFGLIFAAGNVVDGAIVVTEFADSRMAEGMERRAAYSLAARRMAWPIISSTATQLAAFLPLLFWPGVVGEFMKYLPISQFVTMLAALLMALVFVPALGAMFGRPGGGTAASDAVVAIHAHDLSRMRGFTGLYVKVLSGALRIPGTTLLAAVALLAAVTVLYANFGRGVEFFPRVEPDRAIVLVQARGNLSIDERDRLVREVEERVLALQRERREFASIYTRSGIQQEQGGMQDMPEDTVGSIQLEFGPWQDRRTADDILADVLARTRDLAGIVVETRREEGGPPVGKPINLQVSARDPDQLAPTVARIRRHLESMPDLRNIEDTRPLPGIQWRVEVDRAQAAKFGVDVAAVGNMLRLVTNGLKLTEYRPSDSDEEIDIVVRYPLENRTLDELDAVRVQTASGLIPLSNFVVRLPEPRVGTIARVDSRRVMSVRADVTPGMLADPLIQSVQAWLASQDFGPGVEVRVRGQDEEQRKAGEFLSKAFGGAVFLIFLILLAQFNSFYNTILILSAVVMSVFGVLIGLLIAGQPFGIVMSGIGVVALAGIVVANNIVLIDTYAQHRREGRDAREAILVTGAERLRPVILTALNNVLGLMPMMFAVNVDFMSRVIEVGAPSAQWWTQLSQSIVYGLGFATVLTLVLTPCALMLRENVAARINRLRGRGRKAPPPPAANDASGKPAAAE
ncbi:MAG: efflux RND transporter permease subunit [Alphaproteobacteria bacterium]|nr:efflux RND transporter permease subunit [Alphaproteobacteria bacterium]